MSISTAKSYILKAARKSDEMLEPYEWKRSCTVLRRESGSNPADLVDYKILFNKMTDLIEEIQQVQRQTEEMYIDSKGREFILLKSSGNSEQPEKKE